MNEDAPIFLDGDETGPVEGTPQEIADLLLGGLDEEELRKLKEALDNDTK